VLGYNRQQLIEQILGQYVETLFAGNHFWRDRYQHEVDVIHESSEGLIPMEIKYQNHISSSDTKNLLIFMESHQIMTGIIITKDLMDQRDVGNKSILFIPAWLALLVYHH